MTSPVGLLLALVAAGGLAVAQQSPDSAQRRQAADQKADAETSEKAAATDKDKTDKKSAKSEVSDEDRASAMKFAADNHPELARLLEQLQKSRPGEFSRAVRDLTTQIQTLERTREKSPVKYPGQLETWKRDSQVRVLMARWSRNKDPELEKQVRELLRQRHESRIVQLMAEQERMAEHLRKIQEQLAANSQPVESQIDKEWDQLSRKATVRKSGEKKSSELPASAAEPGPKK